MSDTLVLPSLNYGQVRLAWCRAALMALLRRWGIYIVMSIGMLGAFSSGASTSMAAMAAWSVLPVFKAVQLPLGLAFLFSVAHALPAVLIVLALRPILWPRSWLEVVHALPVTPQERRRSDLSVVTLALAPLFALYGAGGAVWLAQNPQWLHGAHLQALLLLSASMGWSLLLGTTIARRRFSPRATRPVDRITAPASTQLRLIYRVRQAQALIRLPLWRGPGRRCANLIALLTATLWGLAVAMAHSSAFVASWWLFGLGLLGMAGTARLAGLIQADLQPLHEACAHLPLSQPALTRHRRALALIPAALGLVALPLAWQLGQAHLRPAVAGAYLLAYAAGLFLQVTLGGATPTSRVSRWMLTVVILSALASEVFA